MSRLGCGTGLLAVMIGTAAAHAQSAANIAVLGAWLRLRPFEQRGRRGGGEGGGGGGKEKKKGGGGRRKYIYIYIYIYKKGVCVCVCVCL